MKYLLLTGFIWLSQMSFAQTQAEMNEQAANSYKKQDEELNHVYQKVIATYASDTVFIEKLRAAQRIWIQFRDAELEMKFPNEEPMYYGSFHPVCYYMYKEELAYQRTETLKQWLDGSQEGEMCSGSAELSEADYE